MEKKIAPVRGQLGHWRYRKDRASGNRFDEKGRMVEIGPPIEGNTTIATLDKAKSLTPPPGVNYNEDTAISFNREEQENLLVARKVGFKSSDKEATLVKRILESNPDNQPADENTADGEQEAKTDVDQIPMNTDENNGQGEEEKDKIPLYTKEELEDFSSKKLAWIIKDELKIKGSMPMSDNGKIKKILDNQK